MQLRPIADFNYISHLINMGLKHGQQFDCGNAECTRCLPYRLVEKEAYDALTDKEKSELTIPHFTLKPSVKGRADTIRGNSRQRVESGYSDDKDWLTWDGK